MTDKGSKRAAMVKNSVFCFWIVAAQVWYYARFMPAFDPLLKSVRHRLWP